MFFPLLLPEFLDLSIVIRSSSILLLVCLLSSSSAVLERAKAPPWPSSFYRSVDFCGATCTARSRAVTVSRTSQPENGGDRNRSFERRGCAALLYDYALRSEAATMDGRDDSNSSHLLACCLF